MRSRVASPLVHTLTYLAHLNKQQEKKGAPPYLEGDKETVSRRMEARTRNPHKLTSRSQHKEPSSGERYQTPESSILRLCKPELVGNEHVGAAISHDSTGHTYTTQQITGGIGDPNPCFPNTHVRSSVSRGQMLWQGFAWKWSLPSPGYLCKNKKNNIHSPPQ